DPRGGRAWKECERLGTPPQAALPPADPPERIADPTGGAARTPIGGPHHECPRSGRDGNREGPSQVLLDELAEEHAGERARQRRNDDDRAEPARELTRRERDEPAPGVGEARH